MFFFHSTDRPAPLHERAGLRDFMNATSVAPQLLDRRDYDALTKRAQGAYDRARILHLSGGIVIATKPVSTARKDIRRLLAENLGRNSGHAGLMLSGASTLGKTTISKSVMKYVHRSYARQFPAFERHGHVPVVYVEVPAGCTGKLLMVAFARFFNLTVARAETADSIRHRVVKALNAAHTQLVVVDELHNLNAANLGNGESIDVLKSLHNQVPATFLYAGIDIKDGPLLAGARGQQLSGRFTETKLERYNLGDAAQARDWRGIVTQFEKSIMLADHAPGTLPELAPYLHQRTNGSIGSLGRLLTGAAIDIIIEGDGRPEALTKEVLDDHLIDLAAETSFTGKRHTTKPKR